MDIEAGAVAVVTGAGSGIGRALCEVLAREGMHILALDVEEDKAAETVSQLDTRRSSRAAHVDVSDRAAMQRLAELATTELGPVKVLCNNAGVSVFGPLSTTTSEDWEWILSVNVMGIVNGVDAFLPNMKAAGGGAHIVNTGALAGLAPCLGLEIGCYSASKAAISAYTEILRRELEPHEIGVSLLLPGRVPTTRIVDAARNRPQRFGGPAQTEAVGSPHPAFYGLKTMDALEVAEKALLGIRANRAIIMADEDRASEYEAHAEHVRRDITPEA
jgi:NAD(P)-dependent dehydrogenase (short-subunit alcohol dehydrogenase family)